jgi:hypothetical protein
MQIICLIFQSKFSKVLDHLIKVLLLFLFLDNKKFINLVLAFHHMPLTFIKVTAKIHLIKNTSEVLKHTND